MRNFFGKFAKRAAVFAAAACVLALSLSALAACDNKTADGGFVIGTTTVIASADRSDYNYDQLSAGLTQQALVSAGADGTYSPLLAEFSTEDSKTWVFTVRDGMCWDDGVPVTADDILFTLGYADEYDSGNWLSSITDTTGAVTESKLLSADVSADGRSITLVFREADVRAPSDLTSLRIMPEHIYEGKTIETATPSENRVGCGVYMFESFSRDAGTIAFVPNPYYPADGELAAERITVRLFGGEDTMYLAFANGELDMLWRYSGGVDATVAATLAENGNAEIIPVAADNLPAVLAFNNSSSPFDNLNLRKAVTYALDYDRFRELFASEYSSPSQAGFVPPTTLGYISDTEVLSRDLEKAREYLEAGLAETGLASLSFRLAVNSGNATHMRYAELVRTSLQDIGVTVTIDAMDVNSFRAATTNGFNDGNVTHQACIIGYTSNGMKMMGGLGTIYMDGTHAVQGVSQVFDEEFLSIADALSAAGTPEEYAAAARECQLWYAENLPAVALYYDSQLQVVSRRFTGFVTDADFGLLNAETWLSLKRA